EQDREVDRLLRDLGGVAGRPTEAVDHGPEREKFLPTTGGDPVRERVDEVLVRYPTVNRLVRGVDVPGDKGRERLVEKCDGRGPRRIEILHQLRVESLPGPDHGKR